MSSLNKSSLLTLLLSYFPITILFLSVFNEFDFNYLENKYHSFNFVHILIFYWTLRNPNHFGYISIFLAGLINDVVTGFPIGLSSFNYLLICGFAAYLRTITLRPNLIKDWFFFLFTILAVNSSSYSILNIFFSIDLNYYNLFVNIFFTFIFYIIFANLFFIYQNKFFKESND